METDSEHNDKATILGDEFVLSSNHSNLDTVRNMIVSSEGRHDDDN